MSITIQQPQPYDIVADTVQIAGVAGGAFEASFVARVTEGHDQVEQPFMAGDGVGGHGQFQTVVDVTSAAFTLHTAFVEVFWTSPQDGAEVDRQVVPVILGRLLVPGYRTFLEHTVQPGQTLWGIAQQHYGDGNLYWRLVSANPQQISNPNLIQPGQILRVPTT